MRTFGDYRLLAKNPPSGAPDGYVFIGIGDKDAPLSKFWGHGNLGMRTRDGLGNFYYGTGIEGDSCYRNYFVKQDLWNEKIELEKDHEN